MKAIPRKILNTSKIVFKCLKYSFSSYSIFHQSSAKLNVRMFCLVIKREKVRRDAIFQEEQTIKVAADSNHIHNYNLYLYVNNMKQLLAAFLSQMFFKFQNTKIQTIKNPANVFVHKIGISASFPTKYFKVNVGFEDFFLRREQKKSVENEKVGKLSLVLDFIEEGVGFCCRDNILFR